MNAESFDFKYRKIGGIKMLNQFKAELKPRKFIAEYFGVTQEAVSKWWKSIYGKPFKSTIPQRRQRRLEMMLELAPTMTKEQWKEAFHYDINTDEAIALLHIKGIKFKEQ